MRTPATAAFTCMMWFGLIGANGAVTVVHAEDTFHGHRLFFTEAQRKQAALIGTDASPDSLPDAFTQGLADADANNDEIRTAGSGERAKANTVDALNAPPRRLPTARRENSANDYQVYFTGLVTGTHQVRVLVNGLPCEPVSAVHSGGADLPVPVDCHGVRYDGLKLTVLTAAAELLVTDQSGRVHRLLPGEGM